MLKTELEANTNAVIEETRLALQTVYDCLNHGQKKQLLKHEEVYTLFERYGVNYEEVG